jgi:hypothetical protein
VRKKNYLKKEKRKKSILFKQKTKTKQPKTKSHPPILSTLLKVINTSN